MIDFQQKKKLKSVVYSKIVILILLILVFFLGKATYNIYSKTRFSYNNYFAVKKDYDSLKSRKGMLESEINRLKTDSGVEEEIRSKFNVAKPGETVVVIINGSSSSKKTDINNSNTNFWSRFWSFFK